MKTYSLKKEGKVFAFEINNFFITLIEVKKVIEETENVSEIRHGSRQDIKSGIYLIFDFNRVDCMVWEPYADNSRYWIGPVEDDIIIDDFNLVEKSFQKYSLWSLLLGKIGGQVKTNS